METESIERPRARRSGPSKEWMEFYSLQTSLFSTHEHVETLIEWLNRPLPVAFRIAAGPAADLQTKALERRCFDMDFDAAQQQQFNLKLKGVCNDPMTIGAPVRARNIPWYSAWTVNVSRLQIRKLDALGRFREWLKSGTEGGSIIQQEIVSMLPVPLLQVEQGHVILDLCAAPGSKTTQILEQIEREHIELWPRGYVVANDPNIGRLCKLLTRVNRLAWPAIATTCYSGESFPNVIEFDRVLCDVPCTGDGTVRKAAGLWSLWKYARATSLAPLQRRLAQRAIELLKVGGLAVYSTCSMNPIENEAVVAAMLRKYRHSVELIDVRSIFPQLNVCASGTNTWKLMEESEDIDIQPPLHDECRWMNLHYCLRVYPQHFNGSAFFIALFKKISHCTIQHRSSNQRTLNEKDEGAYSSLTTHGDGMHIINNLRSFYNLPVDVLPDSSFWTRSTLTSKTSGIYIVSHDLAQLLCDQRIQFYTAGTRMFLKRTTLGAIHQNAEYRLLQNGSRRIRHLIQSRIISVDLSLFETLLRYGRVNRQEYDDVFDRSLDSGSLLLESRIDEITISIVVWLSRYAVSLFVHKSQVQSMVLLLDMTRHHDSIQCARLS